MNIWSAVSLALGVVCLLFGAEWLVKGASAIATKLGIAPIVVGLTVVAFGTSAPELAVSVGGALSDKADVALGNVVGSNTLNILLILGLSAAIGGLSINQRLLKVDIPVLVVVSVVVYLLTLNGSVGRIEGVLLFVGVLAYVGWLLRGARAEQGPEVQREYAAAIDEVEGASVVKPFPYQIGLVVAGLALLVTGSQLLVDSATDIASSLGVSELVIGLTVVAGGTSLPELATSVMAAVRGQRDIAVGNVVGSNLFNLLSVLGASAALSPKGVPVGNEVLRLDFPVMLTATVLLLPICWNGFTIKRWEGAVLASFYVAYVAYLVMEVGDGTAPDLYRTALAISVPLVVVIYGFAGFQGWRAHRRARTPTDE